MHGDTSREEYDAQLLKESIPYRAILAARNAQTALSHGFTAMRDRLEKNQAKEFEYYVEYGMTTMRAIRTGTAVAAELLGWSETAGTVEAGKWADLVAVSGDPLRDIRELQNVKFVMKAGAVFKNELAKLSDSDLKLLPAAGWPHLRMPSAAPARQEPSEVR